MPSQPPRRRLTLADVMILTVGVATALVCWRGYTRLIHIPAGSRPKEIELIYQLAGLAFLLTPLSLMMLIFGLRGVRRRRLASEPSVVVGLAASLVLVYHLASIVNTAARGRGSFGDPWLLSGHAHLAIDQMSLAVGSTWLVLFVSGLWRKPKDWVDVVGLMVSIGWFLLSIATLVPITSFWGGPG